MISDITLGQFFPGFSTVHKLDPRTKIILSVIYIVAVFLAQNPASFLLLTVFAFSLVPLCKISVRTVLKGIKPILLILIFTSILNIFLTPGAGEPLVNFWIIHIYTEGIVRAIFMTLRIIVLIIGTSMFLTYTTSPISLTDGLEDLLSPLRKIHVPVHIFSMMVTIALRSIPILVEETEKIMNAQKSRGADFTSGSLVRRAKALVPLLVPLFVSAFKQAEELATAMECRCYRVDHERTKLNKLSYRARDFIWMLLLVLLLTAIILLRILPYRADISAVWYDILFYRI